MTIHDTRPAGVAGDRARPLPAARPGRPGGLLARARGGLPTLVFLAPMLIIFGVFSWLPIGRAVVMSFQRTNPVTDPPCVGLAHF